MVKHGCSKHCRCTETTGGETQSQWTLSMYGHNWQLNTVAVNYVATVTQPAAKHGYSEHCRYTETQSQ